MTSRFWFALYNLYTFDMFCYDTSSHRDLLLFTAFVVSHSKTEVETCHFLYTNSASTPSICAATAVVIYCLRCFQRQNRCLTPLLLYFVYAVVGVAAVPASTVVDLQQ